MLVKHNDSQNEYLSCSSLKKKKKKKKNLATDPFLSRHVTVNTPTFFWPKQTC